MSIRMTKYNEQEHDFFKLITEHPELPIVPMVDADLVAEDWGRWMGKFGRARVDEYLLTKDGVMFKSLDDVFTVLENYLFFEEYEALPETEDGCRPYYNKLPWKKAIVVNIDLPDAN